LKRQDPEAAKRILIKGDAVVSPEAARVFAANRILLLGNEAQSVGPEDAPMEVHLILLGAQVVLLEGIRLDAISEGVYFLSAAPLNLSGADGSPCRALLIAGE
jgi:arylformamidase